MPAEIIASGLKLLTETLYTDVDIETIVEQKNPNEAKFLKIKGPYIVSEKKNVNGRTYSRGLMENSVAEWKKEWLDTKRSYAELNHPEYIKVDPKNASDLIVSLEQQGDLWIGESIVLCSDFAHNIKGTANGDTLAALIQHGGKIGKSTRGVGQISEDKRVDKVYKLITIDTVVDPSGPGCMVDGILESKEFLITAHGDIMENAIEKFAASVSNIPSHSVKTDIGRDYVNSLFDKFIIDINSKRNI